MGNALIKQAGAGVTKIKFKNYGGPTLEKREVEGLSKARYEFAATSVGDYALFGGGYNAGSVLSNVDAYSTNLTYSTSTALDERRHRFTATANQSYALFGGGERYNSETDYYPNVDAYNADLVHSTAVGLSEGRSYLAATTVGDYSLFAGGNLRGISVDAEGNSLQGTYSSDKVDVYDDNLAQTTATTLSLDRDSLVATTVGDHAIFVSGTKWTGSGGNGVRNVDAYSGSLVHSTPADVTYYSYNAATAVGDYALFGASSNTRVDVYNISLVKLTPVNLSYDKYGFAATAIGNLALFGGGRNSNGKFSKVEGFDNNLALHQFEDLSEGKSALASTTLSKYALFGGGYSSATVECYEYVEKDLELTLLKGTKYKFQNMSNEITVTEDFSTISIPTPVTGYVKFKNANL